MHWYCIHTKPQKELEVKKYLERRLGLEVYFPRLKQNKRIRRVKRVVIRPLFPRYQFCCFDPGQSFRAVRYAPDVLNIVSRGREPQVVSSEIVLSLREWAGEAVDLITIRSPFEPGERVEIRYGPLQGLSAIVMNDMPDAERVAVLLEAMGCGARAVVNRSDIERREKE